MPKIISFAWTTAALLAGAKTCTRRNWDHDYARRFKKGDIVLAYDRSPRAGGKHVATIQLTEDPVYEDTFLAPENDYIAEGFKWFADHPEEALKLQRRGIELPIGKEAYNRWRERNGCEWVIRFQLLEVVGDA